MIMTISLWNSAFCQLKTSFPSLTTGTGPEALQIGNIGTGAPTFNKMVIGGIYNFEQFRLGQFGNGSQAIEFLNHNSSTSSYGIQLMVNIDEVPGLQIKYSSPVSTYSSMVYSTGIYLGLNGNVGIGTTNPGPYRLAVEGKIGAREIKVTLANPWADYVFNKNYKLKPLSELEQFIQKNKHLPGISSAKEVKENGGIDLGQMNLKLLEKVEELTLYVIELKKENDEIRKSLQKIYSKN